MAYAFLHKYWPIAAAFAALLQNVSWFESCIPWFLYCYDLIITAHLYKPKNGGTIAAFGARLENVSWFELSYHFVAGIVVSLPHSVTGVQWHAPFRVLSTVRAHSRITQCHSHRYTFTTYTVPFWIHKGSRRYTCQQISAIAGHQYLICVVLHEYSSVTHTLPADKALTSCADCKPTVLRLSMSRAKKMHTIGAKNKAKHTQLTHVPPH